MNHSETLAKLADALAKAQAEMPVVKFNSINPFLKNKYADLGALIETSRPVLQKYGLAVSQLVSGEGDAVSVETVLLHSSGEFIASKISLPLGEEKGKSSAQVAGSIITYLRRYTYAAALGMYADEDTDGTTLKPQPRAEKSAAHTPESEPTRNEAELISEPETVVEDKPDATKGGKKWSRPFTPESLKEALWVKAQKISNPANEAQTKLFTALWMEYFGKRDDERRLVQEYLTGKKSLKEIDGRMLAAMLDWLKPEKSPDGSGMYVISKLALQELAAVVKFVTEANGQQALI